MALSKSLRGSTIGISGSCPFLNCPSLILLSGFNFGGLAAIILAMSPLVIGGGGNGSLSTGGGGGGGGGGMLQGGDSGRGTGSGVGGGGGKSCGAGSGSSIPIVIVCVGNGLLDLLPLWLIKCTGIVPFIAGGDIVSPGGGGGGGNVSLPVLIDLPLVGVLLADDTVGVELLDALLGGAGGGWAGRLLVRLGVPPPGDWYVSLPAALCPGA